MKKIFGVLFYLLTISIVAQSQKYPVFSDCEALSIDELPTCFNNQIKKLIENELILPEVIHEEKYADVANVVFVVDNSGKFKVIYVNSPYKELKKEVERVFKILPKITPATYDNRAVEMQFVFPIIFQDSKLQQPKVDENRIKPEKVAVKELVEVQEEIQFTTNNSLFPEHKSNLNIPFTHNYYSSFEQLINKNNNAHTAVKPFVYAEVSNYVDLNAQKNKLIKPKESWFGRKLLNEHMAFVKGANYWFTINPMVDLQVGKDNEGETTYNNTRAVKIEGSLGKNLSFSTSFYESQGKFADYFNVYSESIRPSGGNPATIPGRGIAKEFNDRAYDYPVAEAYLSYTPSNFFNFQFGNGKNFIGDGYRSLFLSDATSAYPFFKINTSFWKIKYTNIFATLQDIRPELTVDGAFKQKYMATHYLSWNATKNLNIGLFETVVWDNANDRGFDINYVNPIIFYRAVEFSSGSRAGNSLLGLSFKYKLNDISLYSQLVIDEFRISEVTKSNGWWANKSGIQLGAKYFNAFNVENLYLQAEYNSVRPFTYSHDELNYNFGHNNQPLAHLWGSNFNEFIGIARYSKDRWFANAKVVVGKKGFDFLNDQISYGGNIFRDNDDRPNDYGNEIGQGNKANIFIADAQLGYLVNPATNLKIFGGLQYRTFDIPSSTVGFNNSNSTWISFGLKTDVFNWYFDF